jgi:large subunit ribosomal protein L18
MISKENKKQKRVIRHFRVRNKVSGTSERPRLCINRSLKHVSAQIIDDAQGITLVSASTVEKELAKQVQGKTKQEKALFIGETIAKRAQEKGITTVVFDRAGYVYTGVVKQLADGARNAGLVF